MNGYASLQSSAHLKDDQDAADDAGVPVHHGLLHDVADAAEVARLHGVLLAQEGPHG